MSFIGWLDFSEAEQRQVRELLQLMSTPGTVDDLGIGTVRDAISNQLFPGTSVIQTRARYFLFIPWIYQRAEQRNPGQLLKSAELMERKLISALRASDDLDGLIGRQAGAGVRTLPSAIFWSGLNEYGIFTAKGLTSRQYAKAVLRTRASSDTEDELGERSATFWHRDIPVPPDEFFDFEYADFALTHDEAVWLSERVLSTEPFRGPNLLGCFVRSLRAGGTVPTDAFWDADLPADTPDEVRELVFHAERFSLAIEGAALLYNLLLSIERQDPDRDGDLAAARLEDLVEWWADALATDLPAWAANLQPFWSTLSKASAIPLGTRAFVESWCSLLTRDRGARLADDRVAHELIRRREIEHKRAQARFGNPARLKAWGGESGLGQLEFRWGQIRRFLNDLSAGLTEPIEVDEELEHAAD